MATAKALIEGASLSKSGGTLTYHVSGLDGGEQQAMAQALDVPPIQKINEPHPFITGIKVISEPTVVEVMPGDGAIICRVQVQYGQEESEQGTGAGGTEFSLTSTTMQESTQLDASGNPIMVRFCPTCADGITAGTPEPGGEMPAQLGTVPEMVVVRTLRIVRTERTLPLKSQRAHTGNVNSRPFMFSDPEYWLMTTYAATSSDGGRSYTVTREFSGQRKGWLRGAMYVLPDGSNPAVKTTLKQNANPPLIRLTDIGGQANGADQRQFGGLTVARVQGMSDFNDMKIDEPRNVD